MAKKITFIIPDDVYKELVEVREFYDCNTMSGTISLCIKKTNQNKSKSQNKLHVYSQDNSSKSY